MMKRKARCNENVLLSFRECKSSLLVNFEGLRLNARAASLRINQLEFRPVTHSTPPWSERRLWRINKTWCSINQLEKRIEKVEGRKGNVRSCFCSLVDPFVAPILILLSWKHHHPEKSRAISHTLLFRRRTFLWDAWWELRLSLARPFQHCPATLLLSPLFSVWRRRERRKNY